MNDNMKSFLSAKTPGELHERDNLIYVCSFIFILHHLIIKSGEYLECPISEAS